MSPRIKWKAAAPEADRRVTENGMDLLAILISLLQRGGRYRADDGGPATVVRVWSTRLPVHAIVRPVTDSGPPHGRPSGVPDPVHGHSPATPDAHWPFAVRR